MPSPHRAPARTHALGHRPEPQRRSILLPLLTGFVVLYAVSLGVFALLRYDESQPAAGRVIRDFHAFLGIGPTTARAAPELVPAPKPTVSKPAPKPPRPIVRAPSPLDRVAGTIRRVRKLAPALKQEVRGEGFEEAQIELLSQLCDARDVLNEILDANPGHARANDLWDRLQELLAAIRKL